MIEKGNIGWGREYKREAKGTRRGQGVQERDGGYNSLQ